MAPVWTDQLLALGYKDTSYQSARFIRLLKMMISEDEIEIHLQRLTRGDWCAERNACFIALDSFTIRWLTGFTGSRGNVSRPKLPSAFYRLKICGTSTG